MHSGGLLFAKFAQLGPSSDYCKHATPHSTFDSLRFWVLAFSRQHLCPFCGFDCSSGRCVSIRRLFAHFPKQLEATFQSKIGSGMAAFMSNGLPNTHCRTESTRWNLDSVGERNRRLHDSKLGNPPDIIEHL